MTRQDPESSLAVSPLFLIDDDPTSLNFLRLVLRDFQGRIEAFQDPLKALDRLNSVQPAVVVTDLLMPNVDGFGVLEEVKKGSPRAQVVLLTGKSDIETAVFAIRHGATDYVTKPVDPAKLIAAIEAALLLHNSLTEDCAENSFATELANLQGKLRQANSNAHSALISALDARERETKQHSVRVSLYAAYLAQRMGLPFDRVEAIRIGALLHDIGKIGIPDAILNKPASLTVEERLIMRRHPEIGYEIIRRLVGDTEGAQIVLCHHERVDGLGYPRGLEREEIPLSARIFAVVDAYDALTSVRPYRNPVGHDLAIWEISQCAGTHFDPCVVASFVAVSGDQWKLLARNAQDVVQSYEQNRQGAAKPSLQTSAVI